MSGGNEVLPERTFMRTRTKNIMVKRICGLALAMTASVAPVFAEGVSPFESAVSIFSASMCGPIARGLGLVAIVCGGLAFAFGEHGSKKTLAGIVFGVGMAVGAANFMNWLFA
jgi:type IV secretion system protein TrbC